MYENMPCNPIVHRNVANNANKTETFTKTILSGALNVFAIETCTLFLCFSFLNMRLTSNVRNKVNSPIL